jgi:hypothetical protein
MARRPDPERGARGHCSRRINARELRQPKALTNAQRLLAQYDPPNPAADDPSTTVHELVEQLIRFQV